MVDWGTIVVLFVANGLFDAIAVAWLAGRQSKRKIQAWLTSPESDPYIDRITARVVEKIPKVPQFTAEVVEPPLTVALERKMPYLFDQLAERTGKQISAFMAAEAASREALLRRVGPQVMAGDPKGEMLLQLASSFLGKKEAQVVMLMRQMMKQGQNPFGGAAPQGQFPVYQPPPPPWYPNPTASSPPTYYPGYGPAPLYPNGPIVPTPGAGAPVGYLPAPAIPEGVPLSPPDAKKPREENATEPRETVATE